MDVGFIGLGMMGRAMVTNLLRAGHNVRVWNRSRGPVDDLTRQGASAAESPSEAFTGSAVISMLADDDAVRAVIIGGRLLDGASKPGVHVNMATISIALARELTELHQMRGIAYVAAPVFGRSDIAAAGGSSTSSRLATRPRSNTCTAFLMLWARRRGRLEPSRTERT